MAIVRNSYTDAAYKRMIASGLSVHGACGVIGNIYAESGFNPKNLENLCEKRLNYKYNDETYTQAVDSGEITRDLFLHPLGDSRQYGYGLCQWTSQGRKAGLYDLVKKNGVSIGDPDTQIQFMLHELENGYKSVLQVLKTAATVQEASDIFLVKFECPADTGSGVKKARASYGEEYLKLYQNVEDNNMSYNIQKAISVAENELGYLEKVSNSNLDSKTGNAGSNNYTKYWRDMANLGLGNYQAQYWCAGFIAWVFYMAYGLKAMQQLLLQSFFINCSTMANIAKNAGCLHSDPKVGDVILFYSSSKGYYHTGLVVAVTSSTVTTIEGNTSGGSSVVANGGGVARKTYKRSSLNAKFMRPNYGSEAQTQPESKGYLSKGDTGTEVTVMQTKLIACGFSCGSTGADGDFGSGTDSGLRAFQSAYGLEVDGCYGPLSKAKLEAVYAEKTAPAKKSLDEIAREVIAGKYGNGSERKEKVEAEGFNYDEVQKKVNEILDPGKKSVHDIAKEVIAGWWGNGSERRERLEAEGYNYDEVQAKVNELLN